MIIFPGGFESEKPESQEVVSLVSAVGLVCNPKLVAKL
jgi:hypothetical protein